MKGSKVIIFAIIIAVILNYGVVVEGEELGKAVFLTFDDGPSMKGTEKLIQVLNKNNVRATFFVVGENIKNNPQLIEMMDKNNMSIYPHCNNHKYSELYSSKNNYFNDLNECNKLIKEVTGENKNINFVRLPGGSDNLVCNNEVLKSIKDELIEKEYCYVDWNVDIGDAAAMQVSTDKLIDNINKYAGSYSIEVVLMHDLDTKNTTIDALERVINEYKSMGYKFKTLDEITKEELQYLKNIRVINR